MCTVQALHELIDKYPLKEYNGDRMKARNAVAHASNVARDQLLSLLTTDRVRTARIPMRQGRPDHYFEYVDRPTQPTSPATKEQVDALLAWASWDSRIEDEALRLVCN